jgi:hypothetical protein
MPPLQQARWLVKRAGINGAHWAPRHEIPSTLLEAYEEKRMTAFNAKLEPLLAASATAAGSSAASGVIGLTVRESDAHLCAAALNERWQHGQLKLLDAGKLLGTCSGFNSYGKTLQKVEPKKQLLNSLKFPNALLPHVRRVLPGFKLIEQKVADTLQAHYDTPIELFEAHVLRQGPDSSSATSFDAHQDTEEHDFIEYTAIVKLTPDEPGELPSEMRVVGAPVNFKYGPKPGASGCFRARLYHASVLPASAREHIKIAFFFKKAAKRKRPPQ